MAKAHALMNKRTSLPMAQENNYKFNIKRSSDVAPNPTNNSGNFHLSQSSQSHEASKLAYKTSIINLIVKWQKNI